MRLKQHGRPPNHKIVYFVLSQLLVGIFLRLFKMLIRTLGQGAHIGRNSDLINIYISGVVNDCRTLTSMKALMVPHFIHII